MVAAVISLVMHGFLLAILWMVPSPLPEDPVSDAGLERRRKSYRIFLRMWETLTRIWGPLTPTLPT